MTGHAVLLELIFDSDSQGSAQVVLHVCDESGTPIKRHGSPVARPGGDVEPLPVGSPIEIALEEKEALISAEECNSSTLPGNRQLTAAEEEGAQRPWQDLALVQPLEAAAKQPVAVPLPVPTQKQEQLQPPSPSSEQSAEQPPPLPGPDAPPPSQPPPGPLGECGYGPELLLSVARLLQQLADQGVLAAQAKGIASISTVQQQAVPAAAPEQAGAGPAQGTGPSHWVPQDVQRLLGLELEVVRLQQALKILQLEFQSRTDQVKSLEQKLQDARAEAESAEGRAAQLFSLVHQLKSQCLQLEGSRAAAQQQVLAAHVRERELEAAKVQAERALAAAQQQTGEWRQRLAQLKQENQQLKLQVSTATGNLRTLGIPMSKVFSRSVVAHAQLASPPDSPADLLPPSNDSGLSTARPSTDRSTAGQVESEPTTAQPAAAAGTARPPVVPRLQLTALAAQPGQWSGTATSSQDDGSPSADPGIAATGPVQQSLPAPQAAPSGSASEQQGPQLPPLIDLAAADSPAEVSQSGLAAAAAQTEAAWSRAFPDPGSPALGPSPALAPGGKLKSHGWGSGILGLSQAGVHPAEQHASPLLHSNRPRMQEEALQAAAAAGLLPVPKGGVQQGSGAEGALHCHAADSDGSGGLIAAWRPPARGQSLHLAQQQSHLGQLHRSHDNKLLRASFAASSTAAPAPKPPPRPATARGTPLTARGAQLHTARGPPSSSAKGQVAQQQQQQQQQQRITFSQVAEFQEVMQAYNAVMASEEDKASRWARSMLSNRSAVESDPSKVEPMMQGLIQLFEESGVRLLLRHTGPCQYTAGHSKLVVRLVNGRLMARSGSSNVCVFAWLGKLPVAQQ